MSKNKIGRAGIDGRIKEEAAGKALPFEPLVPNRETIEAMKAARRGELITAGKSSSDLLESLNASR